MDDAAGDKAVLFQHTPHDGVSLVGVNAQGALAQNAGEALGVFDDGGGNAAAAVGQGDGDAVEGDVAPISRSVAVGDLPRALLYDGVGRLAAVQDGKGAYDLPVQRHHAALPLGHITGDHGAVGAAVLPLVDPKGGDAVAGFLDDAHDDGKIGGGCHTNVHG